MAGIHVTGLREIEPGLPAEDREALRRAPSPYYDHFLTHAGALKHWNDNPLVYVIDKADPLREPSREEVRLVSLVNSFLYLCTFASNEIGPGGLQDYTNGSDWALYFQPVHDPEFFSLGERRLYGSVGVGGHRWAGSAFTLPVECNRFELLNVDESLVAGVTTLHAAGRAQGYLFPIRSFMLGTSDKPVGGREQDLPLIWGAIEQTIACDPFTACSLAQNEIDSASSALSLPKNHSLCFVRAVIGSPSPEYVWNQNFRPGGCDEINTARGKGVHFSALERALDELNWARNRVVHDGFAPASDYDIVPLAFIGSRFFIVAFKRILAWEQSRDWTDEDDCEVLGLQALARDGQTSLPRGHESYKQALEECRNRKIINHVLKTYTP